jgi:trk system potassium uptake protein TrkA
VNIIIIGIGEVGSHIARVLIGGGHNVTLIDEDVEAIARAEEAFDAMIVRGHAASPAVLREAGVANCDLFVAVTSICETNLVAAVTAKEMGAKRTIARVTNPVYFEAQRGIVAGMLGIDIVINPMFQIAAEIRRLVRSRSALAIQDFADHQIEMVQLPVEVESRIVGRPLKDIKLPEQTRVAGILRGDDLIVPGGNDSMLPGDEVILIGLTENILEIERLFQKKRSRFGRRAIIVGGGLIALNVARALEDDEFSVTLIEKNKARCQQLVAELDSTVVLHADAMNSSLLEEEGVASSDVFIALSDEDETNLMASLLAKDLGARRCIALVHRPDYGPVCERLGIDATLSPRLTVAQQVLKYVGDGQVVGVSSVMNDRAQFIEYLVPTGARIADKRLAEAALPRGALVCAIMNGAGARVPKGEDIIRPGDQVVVFSMSDLRPRIDKMFKKPIFAFGA